MKVPLHVVEARRSRLAALIQAEGYLPIAEVCARLAISEATARRDLAVLAGSNAITRTRGGALVEYNQRFPSFRDRLDDSTAGKARIAAAARRMIKAGQTVWLDGGTTAYRIAETLARDPVPDLTVVTNNLPVAEVLADRDEIAVHLLGGQYFRRGSLLIGGHALDHLTAWAFDLAFLGAEGMDDAGMWNSQAEIVALQRAVAKRAPRAVFCLDAAKLGRRASEFLLGWDRVDRLLTDATPAALKAAGIALPAKHLIAA